MRKTAEFERIPGSVFVRVSNPNEVAPAPSIERYYPDWSEIAAELANDIPVETPEPTTVIDEVRVYAVHPLTGKRRHLYTGDRADDIQDRCRAYANRSKHRVELHDAERCEVFHPVNPPDCETPISDEPKPPAIRIFNADTDELITEGDEFPSDFETRVKRYIKENNVTLRVETDNGRKKHFYIPESEKKRMALENSEARARKKYKIEKTNRGYALYFFQGELFCFNRMYKTYGEALLEAAIATGDYKELDAYEKGDNDEV